jgi:hypothetical protein
VRDDKSDQQVSQLTGVVIALIFFTELQMLLLSAWMLQISYFNSYLQAERFFVSLMPYAQDTYVCVHCASKDI